MIPAACAVRHQEPDTIEEHVGRPVLVIGRPFGAGTSHHHAPIVMDVVRAVTE